MDLIEREIEESIRGMQTREDFKSFLDLLVRDYDQNLDFWMNQELGAFLRALSAYCQGNGDYLELGLDPNKPRWSLFAEMLVAARAFVEDD